MEAHRSLERFEHGHRVAGGEDDDSGPSYGRNAAMVVAVMAAFLAITTFLSNEAVKHVITGETHRAETSSQLESNRVKIDVAEGNAVMLRALGEGTAQERAASTAAERHEARVVRELQPTDARLEAKIDDYAVDTDHANTQHIEYELAEVALQVGIVLATVSIIARRNWLLVSGGAAGTAGVALLAIGLLLA